MEQMNKFKPGDKVRRITNPHYSGLQIGDTITVKEYSELDISMFYCEEDLETHSYDEQYFELVEPNYTELPEIFGIRQEPDNPLWEKYIQWINKQKKYSSIKGTDIGSIYGINSAQGSLGITISRNEKHFNNNILTLEQWDKIVNKENVLPENYIVICDNAEQTNECGTYMNNHGGKYPEDHNFTHWKYCIKDTNNKDESWAIHSSIIDKYKHLKTFTFNEWKKLIQTNMEKEIIGYKLVKPQYREAVKSIISKSTVPYTHGALTWFNKYFVSNLNEKGYNFGSHKEGICSILENAGVLDLWFEPVYKEEEYKVGDWVTIIPGEKCCFHKGRNTFKIGYINKGSDPKSTFICETNEDEGNGVFFGRFRKATPQEIEEATSFKQGEFVTDDHGKNIYKYSHCSKGKHYPLAWGNYDDGRPIDSSLSFGKYLRRATKEEIERAQVPNITLNGYNVRFDNKNNKLHIGCEKDITYEEAIRIIKLMRKGGLFNTEFSTKLEIIEKYCENRLKST